MSSFDRRTALTLALGATALTASGLGARAQGYPTRPVTVIAPFPPGGSSDTVIRAMSAVLKDALGQSIVVDNKPGANGSIGAGVAARSRPDGYTLLIGSMPVFAVNPSLYKSLPYDPERDFDLLTQPVRTPNAMVVTPSFPANTIPELVEYLKKNPGQVSFATTGAGSTDHLTTVLFWEKTGTTGLHVPYRGGGAAIADVIAGHANLIVTNIGVLSEHVKAGRLKMLAVSSEARDPLFPEVPTFKESGLPDLTIYSWQGIVAPKGLPQDVRAKLETALRAAVTDPTVRSRLEAIGFEVTGTSSADFARSLAFELQRWKAVVDAAKITPE